MKKSPKLQKSPSKKRAKRTISKEVPSVAAPLPQGTHWRALLVDDDAIARGCLRAFLGQHENIEIVAEADNLADAARAATEHGPNLVFLDIHLGEEDGFSLLPSLTQAPEIVFVTSEKERALQAFEVGAVGYLLKPVTAPRLAETLARLHSPSAPPTASVSSPAAPLEPNDTLLLREAGRLHAIAIEKICLIVAEGSFTHVHLRTGEKLFLSQTIGKWEATLPASLFLRLDRSTLVNRARIAKAHALSRDKTLLHVDPLPAPIELGRIGASRLRKLFKD